MRKYLSNRRKIQGKSHKFPEPLVYDDPHPVFPYQPHSEEDMAAIRAWYDRQPKVTLHTAETGPPTAAIIYT